MRNRVLRAWFYFRTGHGGYLSLGVSLVQFLFVAALYLQRIPEFAGLHLAELAVIFIVPYAMIAVFTGWVHTKKQMNTDAGISALQNPFLYKIMPGKEEKIGYPATLLNLQVLKQFVTTFNMMTPEIEAKFDQIEGLIKNLLEGKVIK